MQNPTPRSTQFITRRACAAHPCSGGWWKGTVTLGEFPMAQVLTGKQPPHEIRRHLNLGGRR